MYLIKRLAVLSVLISMNCIAGSVNCDSLTSGNWSAASTWTNCSGTIPHNSDFVTIKSGHVVTLDVNTNAINSLTVEAGGDFDVAFDAAGLTLFGSNFTGANFDLTEASINLFGNFTIDAQDKEVLLGAVNGDFDLTINNSGTSQINSALNGTGGLIKQGSGILTLVSNNGYSGATKIMGGTLILQDTSNNNPIATSSNIELTSGTNLSPINIASFSIASGQTLSGVGTVTSGVVNALGAKISPQYDSVNDLIGIISTSDAVLEGGSELVININGTPDGNEYGKLSVTGSVVVDGATLNLTATNVTAGDQFVIVENDGADAITGTFDLLPEGANLIIGNYTFTISYVGGDGNDITLTETSCQTVQDGLWSADTTWAFCDGAIPQSTDDVNILHAVSFDVDSTIQSIDFGPTADFDVAASGAGLSLNITGALADFSNIDIELNGDFTLINTNNNINLGAIDGNFNLVLNSNQRVFLFGNHTPTMGLKSITTDAGGTTKIANGRTFLFTGDGDTLFNDNVAIGASANVTLNQTGAGNIIFNGNISRSSGSPHRLTLSNDVGETQLNGTVSLGELTTNGTANVVIKGESVSTAQGGANSGDMIFNSPVIIAADTIFTTTGSGEIFFNNTLDDDADGGTGSAVTINNPNQTSFASVGTVEPLDSLTTDVSGTSLIIADIATLVSTTFNDAVTLASDVALTGAIVAMQTDVDNAGFNLTFDASDSAGLSGINGVLSGTGDFIANGSGSLVFSSVNTVSGDFIINAGTIENNNSSENIFPNVQTFSLASGAVASLISSTTGIFELTPNQNIIGSGYMTGIVDRQQNVNVNISAGFSPSTGQLTFDRLYVDEFATLTFELNGTSVGTEYDQIIALESIQLEYDLENGTTLEVLLGFTPSIGDVFTIIDNQSANSVGDRFKGLSEGATLSFDNNLFSISYIGGDGNDVVLTALGSSIIYVDKTAAAMGDGASWMTAFDNLQDALAVAVAGSEIWVAQGIYYPDVGMGQVDGDSSSTFSLVNGLSLYGGFNGTETDRSQKNPTTNLTILSGDIDDNDTIDANGITLDYQDLVGLNAYHLITSFNTDTSTLIDGFTLTGASAAGSVDADKRGSVVNCNDGSITLNNLTVQGNRVENEALLWSCTSIVNNSSFINNYSNGTGTVSTYGGTYSDVFFIGNRALDQGSAFYLESRPLTLNRVSFMGNSSENFTGVIRALGSTLNFNDVLFSGNDVGDTGGAMELQGPLVGVFNNVTITGNNSSLDAGGIKSSITGTLEINNSILWNNQDSTGTGSTAANITHTGAGTITINSSIIQGSGGSVAWSPLTLVDGGGNLDIDPEFMMDTDPSTAPTTIGNARLQSTSMAIDTGDNSFVTSTTDLNNRDRIVNTTVDMGAYEYFVEEVFKDGFE